MCKNIIKTFKDIAFAINVETNLKIVDILDIMLNLNNDTIDRTKNQTIY